MRNGAHVACRILVQILGGVVIYVSLSFLFERPSSGTGYRWRAIDFKVEVVIVIMLSPRSGWPVVQLRLVGLVSATPSTPCPLYAGWETKLPPESVMR